jgi:hypothetical protein
MGVIRLVAFFGAVAYIVWWFWTLITWAKPLLDVGWSNIASFTIWQTVSILAFFIGGIIGLIFAIYVIIATLFFSD